MKLCYRGVCYDYNPPEVATPQNTETVGTYRGIDVRFRNPKKALVLQPTLDLKYRGVAYRQNEATSEVAKPIAEPTKTPALSVQDKARSLMLSSNRKAYRRQKSMFDRLAAEVGLTANVSEYWQQLRDSVDGSGVSDRSAATLS